MFPTVRVTGTTANVTVGTPSWASAHTSAAVATIIADGRLMLVPQTRARPLRAPHARIDYTRPERPRAPRRYPSGSRTVVTQSTVSSMLKPSSATTRSMGRFFASMKPLISRSPFSCAMPMIMSVSLKPSP